MEDCQGKRGKCLFLQISCDQQGRQPKNEQYMSKNQGKDGLVFFASILSKMSQMFSEINSIYLQAMVNKKSSDLAPEFNVNQLFSEFQKEEKNKVADLEELDDILQSENQSKHEEVRQPPKRTKKEAKKNNKQQQENTKKPKEPTLQSPTVPPSSYLLFFNEHRSKITEEFPNLNVAEQSKIASKCWRELTEEQKKPYHDRFNEEKQRYYQELKIYNEMKGNEQGTKKKLVYKPKASKNEKKNQAAIKEESPKDRLIPGQPPRQQNQQSSQLSSSITI